jgi:dTDP-glucose pyrophosphorylase
MLQCLKTHTHEGRFRPEHSGMSKAELIKAVLLARGLGTRMRRLDSDTNPLDPVQTSMADAGLKAMIPVGRPFLDYVLTGLADAGFQEVCLIIGPEHGVLREYYTHRCIPKRLRISFAIQERPLGTADAVAAAESFVAGGCFLMLNSDNYYPISAIRALRLLGQPALAAFERESLIEKGNIGSDRIRQFAVVTAAPDGALARIVEKPDETTLAGLGAEIYVSMNCWAFSPAIFRACAAIEPSPRGELELTDAVQYAIHRLGEHFRIVRFRAGVLDLSSRSDIAAVAEILKGVEVNL